MLRQKTAHFKAKNVHSNWIACALLCLKMSADIGMIKIEVMHEKEIWYVPKSFKN